MGKVMSQGVKDENSGKTEGSAQQCSTVRAMDRWGGRNKERKGEMGGGEGERTREMVCGCQATIDNQIPKHRACAALPSLQA